MAFCLKQISSLRSRFSAGPDVPCYRSAIPESTHHVYRIHLYSYTTIIIVLASINTWVRSLLNGAGWTQAAKAAVGDFTG
ncbi:hypothetical protein BP00DRAFT_209580 [Aspergillus indologenus CBS 114.80]|uniref:Uncharacterized protein n=1 Tax=Aspergillus indologenus CBS 114.80 TaxID=1450541 RepID=A0A2V5I834_9EURO|nr:hypothetical protein BP00DRAFT_209580 [Aspergillus indologenus CBS 114.80]